MTQCIRTPAVGVPLTRENYARCTLCSADFSIAASGRYNITQHIATAKHRSNAERKDSNQCF